MEEFEELVEAREQERAGFQPAPRNTQADQSGDLQSLQRRLDKVLYLLVKKKRSNHSWQMPQGSLTEGESLLQVSLSLYFTHTHTLMLHTHRQQRESSQGTVGPI